MKYIKVGKLGKAFGTKGFVKVIPEKAFEDDLRKTRIWFIERGPELLPFFVQKLEEIPHFLVQFEDINSPEDSKLITGCFLKLREVDVVVQKGFGETDLEKLIGFEVHDNREGYLGIIDKIEEFPQQIMAFVKKDELEILMPLNEAFISDIDIEMRKIYVDLPKGFVSSQM